MGSGLGPFNQKNQSDTNDVHGADAEDMIQCHLILRPQKLPPHWLNVMQFLTCCMSQIAGLTDHDDTVTEERDDIHGPISENNES